MEDKTSTPRTPKASPVDIQRHMASQLAPGYLVDSQI